MIDTSIQSKQASEKQQTDRLIRQLEKEQQRLKRAANRAFYKSAAFRRTYTYQRIEEAREARGLPRDPRERIVK